MDALLSDGSYEDGSAQSEGEAEGVRGLRLGRFEIIIVKKGE